MENWPCWRLGHQSDAEYNKVLLTSADPGANSEDFGPQKAVSCAAVVAESLGRRGMNQGDRGGGLEAGDFVFGRRLEG